MKKIISLFMSVIIITCLSITTFAKDVNQNNSTGDTIVDYNSSTVYTVTIPEYIIPANLAETRESYSVGVKDVLIPYQSELDVNIEYNNVVVSKDNVKIPYYIYEGQTGNNKILSGSTILSIKSGELSESSTLISAELTEKPVFSGQYTDTAIFSFNITESNTTNYTSDEIDTNPLLVGIGATKPEYVVAEFNAEKTEVVITKNSSLSDGKMIGWKTTTDPIANPFSQNKTTLKKVTINKGITNIGDMAFRGCTKISNEIFLPDTISSIGQYAFNGVGIQGDLIIPENVTEIGYGAFQNCTKLTGLSLGRSVANIGVFSFAGCTGLKGNIVLPDSVKKIGAFAFQSCRALNGILLLNEGLEHIGDGAFNQDLGFSNKVLKLPSSLSSIGGDTNFKVTSTSATMTTPPVENYNIGTHIFYNFATYTLQKYEVADGNTNFKAVDGVLYSADGKRLIAYPASREGSTYEIIEGVTELDELAFSRIINGSANNKLTSLVLPNSYIIKEKNQSGNILNRGNANSLSSALYTHNSLTEIKIKGNNPNYKAVDGCVYSKDGTTLYYVPFAKSGNLIIPEGTTTISFGALYGLEKASEHPNIPGTFTNLSSLSLPSSLHNLYDVTLTRLNTFLKLGKEIRVNELNQIISMLPDGSITASKTLPTIDP